MIRKEDYNLNEIREMSDKEFDDFSKFKVENVFGKMGISPTEEALYGMWTMYKYIRDIKISDLIDDISEIVDKDNKITGGREKVIAFSYFLAGAYHIYEKITNIDYNN